MGASYNSAVFGRAPEVLNRRALRMGVYVCLAVVTVSAVAGIALPRGLVLATVSDVLQVGLAAATAVLAFQNFLRSQTNVRAFWLLIFIGAAMWCTSLLVWSIYEIGFQIPSPDAPLVDSLLFVKLVPFTAAAVLEPHKRHDLSFRAFGLLDVCILMLYSLYLFAFFVYAFHLIPGSTEIYNYRFSLADAIGNQMFALVVGVSVFRAQGDWRSLYRIYFLAASSYCLISDLSNVALDLGHYYSGSIYDIALVVSMCGFVCFCLAGRPAASAMGESKEVPANGAALKPRRVVFYSSHLAMLVTLSTPVIGLWLVTDTSAPRALLPFRLSITLCTIFLLTLLLSLKQDLLSESLIGSLQRLTTTYSSIDRFKNHLVQSEKLTSLGELVAQVANQIKDAMKVTSELAARVTVGTSSEPRIRTMAGKIGQYAERTDALVENMLRFAQETPLQLTSLALKPLVESALHLSRIGKRSNLRVELVEAGPCAPVRGDSSQLLHVFLQIISNAVDAMEETGGALTISILAIGTQTCIEFADTGPGIQQPERVFEPFYTTKPVGKGTGLGLSTCYGIIQQHKGEITCTNRAQGGGIFRILLPTVEVAAASADEPDSIAMEGVR
jgi:signal transduction histidine kinase